MSCWWWWWEFHCACWQNWMRNGRPQKKTWIFVKSECVQKGTLHRAYYFLPLALSSKTGSSRFYSRWLIHLDGRSEIAFKCKEIHTGVLTSTCRSDLRSHWAYIFILQQSSLGDNEEKQFFHQKYAIDRQFLDSLQILFYPKSSVQRRRTKSNVINGFLCYGRCK